MRERSEATGKPLPHDRPFNMRGSCQVRSSDGEEKNDKESVLRTNKDYNPTQFERIEQVF